MVNASPKTYVFDLDGVIYRGEIPLPHASETLLELEHRGRKVFFFTNNSAAHRDDYLSKLSDMGIPVSYDKLMTSAYATVLYLKEHDGTGRKAYVVGGAGLVRELREAGVDVVCESESPACVDYVIVGLDREFTYDKLKFAQHAILSGAKFIATNTDATYPVEDGVVLPGGGSIVASIRTASGAEPVVIGKPETYALEKILEFAGTTAEESVMVGDRLETDILLGKRAGMHTVLPLTGVTDERMVVEAPFEMKPERVIRYLDELLDESWASR